MNMTAVHDECEALAVSLYRRGLRRLTAWEATAAQQAGVPVEQYKTSVDAVAWARSQPWAPQWVAILGELVFDLTASIDESDTDGDQYVRVLASALTFLMDDPERQAALCATYQLGGGGSVQGGDMSALYETLRVLLHAWGWNPRAVMWAGA